MAVSSTHNGWRWDRTNSRLDVYYRGTRVGHISATAFVSAFAMSITGGITAATSNIVATLGDLRITAGNVRCGVVSAFATTEPTSAVVLKSGTAPSGAVATSSGIYANDTVLRKVIADGTLSNVET